MPCDQFGDIDARFPVDWSLRRCDRPSSPALVAASSDDASPLPALPPNRAAARAAAAVDNRPIAQRKPKRNSNRGLQWYGTVYAPSGFRPRAKSTPKPFRDPANDHRRQTTLGANKRKRSSSPQRSASPLPPPSPVGAPPPSTPATQPSASRKKRSMTKVGTASKVLTEAAHAKIGKAAVAAKMVTASSARRAKMTPTQRKTANDLRTADRAAKVAKMTPVQRKTAKDKAAAYMRTHRAADPKKANDLRTADRAAKVAKMTPVQRKTAKDKAAAYMRARRAADPNSYFHDTYQTSLIGRLRGTRPSKLVDGLRKACTVPPAAVDDIFDHLKSQTPPRVEKWMCVATWGKGKRKCELDHMFPKRLKSGIKGVTGYKHTLEDIFREYNDDNMQGLLGTDNRIKSNSLPSVPVLAACRNTWPLHWGDVLPAAIPCTRDYEYLRKARPLVQQTFYSKLTRDPYYDSDWIKSLCDLFGIKS